MDFLYRSYLQPEMNHFPETKLVSHKVYPPIFSVEFHVNIQNYVKSPL